MAGVLRVSTFFCDIRHAPSARKIVRTTGNSSGSIAMASVIPARRPLIQLARVSPYTTTTAAKRTKPSMAQVRTIRPVSRLRAVSSVSTV